LWLQSLHYSLFIKQYFQRTVSDQGRWNQATVYHMRDRERGKTATRTYFICNTQKLHS
jgi:hypothetical protein